MNKKPIKLAIISGDWKEQLEIDDLNKAIKYIGGEVRIKEVETGGDFWVYFIYNVIDKPTQKYLQSIWDLSTEEDGKFPKGVKHIN